MGGRHPRPRASGCRLRLHGGRHLPGVRSHPRRRPRRHRRLLRQATGRPQGGLPHHRTSPDRRRRGHHLRPRRLQPTGCCGDPGSPHCRAPARRRRLAHQPLSRLEDRATRRARHSRRSRRLTAEQPPRDCRPGPTVPLWRGTRRPTRRRDTTRGRVPELEHGLRGLFGGPMASRTRFTTRSSSTRLKAMWLVRTVVDEELVLRRSSFDPCGGWWRGVRLPASPTASGRANRDPDPQLAAWHQPDLLTTPIGACLQVAAEETS